MASKRPKVHYATVFIFPGARGGKPRVSAAPERLFVRGGDKIEWTVVNATPEQDKVSFAWRGKSPLKKEPEAFTRASDLRTVSTDAKPGSYKYSILVNGEDLFDPEIEIV